jgi:3-deoxy-D-arabino-heptulosonate 7-phosphate (DAHP) synthase
VTPLALAGTAAGADGLLIEVHPRPVEALSDGDQSVTPSQFAELAVAVRGVHAQVRAIHATRGPAMAADARA